MLGVSALTFSFHFDAAQTPASGCAIWLGTRQTEYNNLTFREAAARVPDEEPPGLYVNRKRVPLLILLPALALAAPPEGRGVRASFAGGYMYSYYVPPAASTPWRPAWSPHGKEVAFSMAGSIWKVRAGETVAYELTANPTNDSSPAWSPHRHSIAYTTEDERRG